jgi:multiple sugar transport system ATP-binding protein
MNGGRTLLAHVVLEHIGKSFGNVVAVDDVSMSIEDKSFVALLGPSGCGKTTTLRLIAGLETLTTGNIRIGEKLVNDLSPRDRNIAMVFQSYALYPHMTVFDNMAFPLKIRKVPKDEAKKRVNDAASILEIQELLHRKPKELSGGQRQRVALGRAIVRNPEVFLLDEPLSNLDAKLRVYMRAELKRLQRRLGVTTIYVTHDQIEALTMSDKIAVMNEGKIQQVDGPDELYSTPANTWVAGFIGSPPMNFFDCTMTTEGRHVVLDTSEFKLEIDPGLAAVIRAKSSSNELVLGTRPEDLTVVRGKGEIPAEIYVVEPVGESTIVDLKIGRYLAIARAPAGFKAGIGEKVSVALAREKIHIFDKKTDQLIV